MQFLKLLKLAYFLLIKEHTRTLDLSLNYLLLNPHHQPR